MEYLFMEWNTCSWNGILVHGMEYLFMEWSTCSWKIIRPLKKFPAESNSFPQLGNASFATSDIEIMTWNLKSESEKCNCGADKGMLNNSFWNVEYGNTKEKP
ncbi:hypothetical protein AVEN_48823-1 [Araneus ventricosus]|uniref:Uncharacterized protein n=1 Tax=Araneus ventricosus TaxID=182803 RepID=A0A4Y2VQW7_ARAVE|nr:hypothetical protein AVEN_48823-1 [Araneus ventricosus]